MLIQRLAEDLKRQNWTSVAIEILVLTLGVFLGLQAENWNQSRKDRSAVLRYTVRLIDDFAALRDRFGELIAEVLIRCDDYLQRFLSSYEIRSQFFSDQSGPLPGLFFDIEDLAFEDAIRIADTEARPFRRALTLYRATRQLDKTGYQGVIDCSTQVIGKLTATNQSNLFLAANRCWPAKPVAPVRTRVFPSWPASLPRENI